MSLLLVALVLQAVIARPGAGPPSDMRIEPTTCRSRSGAFVLELQPSHLDDAGPARYRLLHDGVEVWSGERGMTLSECAVSDAGVVAGCAYTAGRWSACGEFHVVIWSANGDVILDQVHEVKGRRGFHGPVPDPNVRGILLHEDADLFLLRVVEREDEQARGESWWRYRVSTGEDLGLLKARSVIPDASSLERTTDAIGIRGTNLVLAQWLEEEHPNEGVRFVLSDSTCSPIWSLDLPNEYSDPSLDAGIRIRRFARPLPAILPCDVAAQFEIRLVREGMRVTYRIEDDSESASGKRVVEVGRAIYVVAGEKEFVARNLSSFATVPLGIEPPPRDSKSERDRVAVPVPEGDRFVSDLTHVDRLGRIFVSDKDTAAVRVFDARGQLLAICNPLAFESRSRIDDSNLLEGIQGIDDGGIVLEFGSTAMNDREGLAEFGSDGRRIDILSHGTRLRFAPSSRDAWSFDGDEGGSAVAKVTWDRHRSLHIIPSPDHAFGVVDDVAVAPDGSVAVLGHPYDGSGSTVAMFTSEGEFVRSMTFSTPAFAESLAFTGDRLLLGWRDWFLVDVADGTRRRLLLDVGNLDGRMFFSPDGRELWFVQRSPLQLRRYAMPE